MPRPRLLLFAAPGIENGLYSLELLHLLVAARRLAGQVQHVAFRQSRHFKTAELAVDATDGHFPRLDVQVRSLVLDEHAEEIC